MPAALGLTTYRWNNNTKSVVLLLAFPFLLLVLFGGIFLVFGMLLDSLGSDSPNPLEKFALVDLQPVLGTDSAWDFAVSAMYAWWPLIFGIASAWMIIGYLFNGWIIHKATGAKPVSRTDQPQLYNLLENLCISRGLTMPQLYIIDTDVMNAYASGIDQRTYAITVTRGLLEQLNSDELEAVLAHELTHIIDRDCRLMIVAVVFTGMLSFLAQLLWRGIRVAAYSRGGRKGGGAVIIMMLIGAVAMVVGYVLALMLRLALSRRREYLADAGSVELTKNPDALIGALVKISQNPDVPHVPSEVRQMFIENPPSGFDLGGLFATHPPIAARIHVLEELGGHPPESLEPPPSPQLESGEPGATSFKSPWA